MYQPNKIEFRTDNSNLDGLLYDHTIGAIQKGTTKVVNGVK